MDNQINQNKHKHDNGMSSEQEEFDAKSQGAQQQKKRPVLHRLTSLTDDEKYALVSLLIDSKRTQPPKTLTKELLLTTPFSNSSDGNLDQEADTEKNISQRKPAPVHAHNSKMKRRRNSSHHTGLWRAHENGILHKALRKGSSMFQKRNSRAVKNGDVRKISTQMDIPSPGGKGVSDTQTLFEDKDRTNASVVSSESVIGTGPSARSDVSQCKSKTEDDDNSSISSTSSWGDDPVDHYNSWQLLKDEYAEDYGFGYKPDLGNIDEGSRRSFEILGTSADDLSAQPHVLSPPLMESLLSFVPESLSCENWWLKYSLVRDGASLETFRNYTKAAQNTVVAIQTTTGYVFGCFTGSPWRINHGYFGSGEAFVWKMRYNRFLKCVSLYDQGTLESIVDVYPFSGLNKSVQLCHQDFIAVGGGEVDHALVHDDDVLKHVLNSCQKQEHGFAIALHGDLQRGTSSPSSTFCNPKLTGEEDGIFEIANLEVWTLTPCMTVQDAEQLEMRKYFLHEKLSRSNVSSLSSMGSTESPTSPYSSQRVFYHRLGEDDDEVSRDRWNLASIQSESLLTSLSGKSPRFVT